MFLETTTLPSLDMSLVVGKGHRCSRVRHARSKGLLCSWPEAASDRSPGVQQLVFTHTTSLVCEAVISIPSTSRCKVVYVAAARSGDSAILFCFASCDCTLHACHCPTWHRRALRNGRASCSYNSVHLATSCAPFRSCGCFPANSIPYSHAVTAGLAVGHQNQHQPSIGDNELSLYLISLRHGPV
jgi:hypothetical protein